MIEAALTAFVLIVPVELPDKTFVATLGRTRVLGSWAALAAVSGAAVLLGRWMLRRVRLSLVRYIAAGVCAVLAAVTVIGTLSAP